MNRQFSKEVQMATKYMKKCSTPLGIEERQIKMTLRFYLISVKIAVPKKTSSKCWQRSAWRGEEPSCPVFGNVN
jgi:hypothetical protein